MLKEYGYVRVGSVSNKLEVGNVEYNVKEIITCLDKAKNKGIEILTFPELSLTGSTCKDLFLTEDLINHVNKGIKKLKAVSKEYPLAFIIGAPLKIENSLYDCAISISKGKILGITPKTYLSSDQERYFKSALNLNVDKFAFDNEEIMISNLLIYKCKNYDFISYAIELGEDAYVSNSISNYASLLGANIIFNLSSEEEIIKRKEYRRDFVQIQASKTTSAYVYASSGANESTSDGVYMGHLLISEPYRLLNEDSNFSFESKMIYSDVDLSRINNDRIKNSNFNKLSLDIVKEEVYFELEKNDNELSRVYDKKPLLVDDYLLEDIINIQTYGLAKRIKHLNNAKMVIGISGGSDSTLAFLICLKVVKVLGLDNKDIIAVTMPGFGTSNKTYNNAINLIKYSGATLKEISIVDACKQHYKDIGHDEFDYDITYENAQARERTQILFDLANDLNGIVIGTGDLSELALGWATYNGDQMSNYGVNVGVSKTLVMALINKLKDDFDDKIKDVLNGILNTPISPELLPLDKDGNIVQESQKSIGPYILHDFFLYHFIRYGASVKKIYYLACLTFKDEYSKDEIKATLTIFIKRFFTQQFKRSALADGVKIGSVNLAKLDFRFNSDIKYSAYLNELENL